MAETEDRKEQNGSLQSRPAQTSSQVDTITRVLLVGLLTVGAIAWSQMSLHAWSSLAGGLLATWLLWLMARTVEGRRGIGRNGMLAEFLIPAGVLGAHAFLTVRAVDDAWALNGSMDASAIFHLFLLMLGTMLCQDVLAHTKRRQVVLSIAAGPMILSCGLTAWTVQQPLLADALWLTAGASAAIWFWAWWPDRNRPAEKLSGRWRRVVALAPGCAWLVLMGVFPVDPVNFAVLALALLVCGAVAGAWRKVWLAVGAVCGLLAAAAWLRRGSWLIDRPAPVTLLGRGEEAFATIWAGSPGLWILLGMVGLVPLAAMLVWAGYVWTGHLLGGMRRVADPIRVVAMQLAALLAGLAILAPGATMLPTVSLAVMVTWGLLPQASRMRSRQLSGLVLIVPFFLLLLLIGVIRIQGLVVWMVYLYRGTDIFLHAVGGLLMAMTLFWWLGSRGIVWGVLALVLSIGAGGIGEGIQYLWTTRSTEWKDFFAHLSGSLIAVVPYLLCMGARLGGAKRSGGR